jgi:DNA-binding transcriptional MocR family regulator
MNQFDFQRAVMASDLDGTTKWILVVIGSHVNWKTGQAAFPSIDTLVKESGFSKATIHRAKLKLVSQGYLVSQRHYNKSNTYLVMIPGSLTMTPGSLTERLEWSHNEELKDNITDNIKENIKENNKSSSEDLYIDSKTKEAKENINIDLDSDHSLLASFKEQTPPPQTKENIDAFWAELGK